MSNIRHTKPVKRIIYLMVCLILLLCYFGTDISTLKVYATSNGSVVCSGTYDYYKAYEVLKLVNKERAAYGLPALVMDKDLISTAMKRAAEISVYYSHTRPNGTSCFTVSGKQQIGYAGENIAAGQASAIEVTKAWLKSAGHKSNILNPNFKSIGIGCYNQDGVLYWVQSFSSCDPKILTKPKNKNVRVTIPVKSSLLKSSLLRLKSKSSIVKVNATLKIYPYLSNSGWKAVPCKLYPGSFNWSSSNKKIATVNGSGIVKGKKIGKVKITAKLKTYPYSKVSFTVTVRK